MTEIGEGTFLGLATSEWLELLRKIQIEVGTEYVQEKGLVRSLEAIIDEAFNRGVLATSKPTLIRRERIK